METSAPVESQRRGSDATLTLLPLPPLEAPNSRVQLVERVVVGETIRAVTTGVAKSNDPTAGRIMDLIFIMALSVPVHLMYLLLATVAPVFFLWGKIRKM